MLDGGIKMYTRHKCRLCKDSGLSCETFRLIMKRIMQCGDLQETGILLKGVMIN